MHRVYPVFAVFVALSGCAPAPGPSPIEQAPPAAPGALQAGQMQAYFATYPDRLIAAAVAACNSPGQRPEQPDASGVRCVSLPTPDVAAALILSYGGTVSALPEYVVSFDVAPLDQGYIVTGDNYVTVPQTDGTIRTIRLADPTVSSGLTALLTAAGGVPVDPQ